MLCARLELIFALQFRQCPDFEQNIRNPVFVHEHEDDSRVSTEAKKVSCKFYPVRLHVLIPPKSDESAYL
jgi:hypothetical protein